MTDPRLPTVDEARLNRDVAGASASERLRQTQAALAASQQDLSRALARCGELADRAWDRACERDLARAELATATRELEQLRALHDHCPTGERQ